MPGSCIYFAEKNIHGAWVIYGILGVRHYYGYTKNQSMQRYRNECERTFVYEQKKKGVLIP